MTPTEYEFQRLAVLRNLDLFDEFKRTEVGFKGEEKFNNYLKEFGSKHWIILRNYWFNDNSIFECDFILITKFVIYVFEVKNYYGKFLYENGQCFSRGTPITYNPINQVRNAKLHLQNILPQYPIKGALIFIGEHNHIAIKDEVKDINILETNEVYDFIQFIKQEEARYTGLPLKVKDIRKKLELLNIQPPYLSVPYTSKEMLKATKGILCANCHQKVLITRNQYVTCTCGLQESKEEAIIRTACEYGVLTYGINFTVRNIYDFIDQQSAIDYVRRLLLKHFDTVSQTRLLTFRNLNRDYPLISDTFEIALPKIMMYY